MYKHDKSQPLNNDEVKPLLFEVISSSHDESELRQKFSISKVDRFKLRISLNNQADTAEICVKVFEKCPTGAHRGNCEHPVICGTDTAIA